MQVKVSWNTFRDLSERDVIVKFFYIKRLQIFSKIGQAVINIDIMIYSNVVTLTDTGCSIKLASTESSYYLVLFYLLSIAARLVVSFEI